MNFQAILCNKSKLFLYGFQVPRLLSSCIITYMYFEQKKKKILLYLSAQTIKILRWLCKLFFKDFHAFLLNKRMYSSCNINKLIGHKSLNYISEILSHLKENGMLFMNRVIAFSHVPCDLRYLR